jgi:LysM repeat protein
MLNIVKDLLKSSFFAVILGMLVIGFLMGYTMASLSTPQKQTAYAQQHTVETKTDQPVSSKTITVKKGDTLWGIAKTYFPNHPIEQVVQYLKKVNQLQSDQIKVGDTLKLS